MFKINKTQREMEFVVLPCKLTTPPVRKSYLRHGALSLEPSGVPLLGLAGCWWWWWVWWWWGWGEWGLGSEKQGLFSFSAGEMTSSVSHCSRTSKDWGRRLPLRTTQKTARRISPLPFWIFGSHSPLSGRWHHICWNDRGWCGRRCPPRRRCDSAGTS